MFAEVIVSRLSYDVERVLFAIAKFLVVANVSRSHVCSKNVVKLLVMDSLVYRVIGHGARCSVGRVCQRLLQMF